MWCWTDSTNHNFFQTLIGTKYLTHDLPNVQSFILGHKEDKENEFSFYIKIYKTLQNSKKARHNKGKNYLVSVTTVPCSTYLSILFLYWSPLSFVNHNFDICCKGSHDFLVKLKSLNRKMHNANLSDANLRYYIP